MGKAGRIACIFLPWLMTITSFILIILLQLPGTGTNNGWVNRLYFMDVDFSNFSASSSSDSSALNTAIQTALSDGVISDIYRVNIWDYCSGNTTSGNGTNITYCSPRKANYYFNPVDTWQLSNNSIFENLQGQTGNLSSEVGGQNISSLTDSVTDLEKDLFGDGAADALKTYQKVSHWMFIAYMVSIATMAVTILVSFIAVFSRWGSFLTWIFASLAALFTTAASVTATAMFAVLVGAIDGTLSDYNISTNLGGTALTVTWIATALIDIATLFWLFSACCCSGKSNPHHHSNPYPPAADLGVPYPSRQAHAQGASPPPYSYNDASGNNGNFLSRGRSLRVEQTGGGGSYERVASPYMEHFHGADHDTHPLEPMGGAGGLHASSPSPSRMVSRSSRYSGDTLGTRGYGHVRANSSGGTSVDTSYGGRGGNDRTGGGGAYEPFRHA